MGIMLTLQIYGRGSINDSLLILADGVRLDCLD